MLTKKQYSVMVCFSTVLPLLGCGGSGSTTMADLVKLSGPLSLAAAASDVPTASASIGIVDTLASFPAGVLEDFASRFPSVSAEEQSRRIIYSGGTIIEEVFTVEGDNPTEDLEVIANYAESGNYLSSFIVQEIISLPVAVADAVAVLYPAASFDEVEERADQNGNITYQVEFYQSESEFELTLDDTGNILLTVEEVTTSQVPSSVSMCFQQELMGIGEVEYELITDNVTGVLAYEAEVESAGEGVLIRCSDVGDIVLIEYSADILSLN